MSTLEARLQSIPADPGITDPDFDICIIARANMTAPCAWAVQWFCDWNDDVEGQLRSCWGGHILRALGGYADGPNSGYTSAQSNAMNRIACKLGFDDGMGYGQGNLYTFNDTHSHAEVIAEFDRRLQLWGA